MTLILPRDAPLRLLLQDSWYDRYRGAVLLVQVLSGSLRIGDSVTSVLTEKTYSVRTLAALVPEQTDVEALFPGQVWGENLSI